MTAKQNGLAKPHALEYQARLLLCAKGICCSPMHEACKAYLSYRVSSKGFNCIMKIVDEDAFGDTSSCKHLSVLVKSHA